MHSNEFLQMRSESQKSAFSVVSTTMTSPHHKTSGKGARHLKTRGADEIFQNQEDRLSVYDDADFGPEVDDSSLNESYDDMMDYQCVNVLTAHKVEYYPIVSKSSSDYIPKPIITRSQRRQKYVSDRSIQKKKEEKEEMEAQSRKFKQSVDVPTKYTDIDPLYEKLQERKRVLKDLSSIEGKIIQQSRKNNQLKNQRRKKDVVYPSNEEIKQEIEAKKEAKRIREDLRASRMVQLASEQAYEKELHSICESMLDGVTSVHDLPQTKLKDILHYFKNKFVSGDYSRELVEVEVEELQEFVDKLAVEPQMFSFAKTLGDAVELNDGVRDTVQEVDELTDKITEKVDKYLPEVQFTTSQVKSTVDGVKGLMGDPDYKKTLDTVEKVVDNSETFLQVAKALKESVEMIKSLFDGLGAPKTKTFDIGKILLLVTKCVAVGLVCYTDRSSATKLLAVFSLVTDVPYLLDVVKGISNWIFSSTEMKPQVNDGVKPSENLCMTIVKCIGSIFSARNLDEMKQDSIRFSRITNITRFVTSFPDFLVSFKNMLVASLHYVYEWMFNEPLYIFEDEEFKIKTSAYIAEVCALQDHLISDAIKDPSWRDRIKLLKKQRDAIDLLMVEGSNYRHPSMLIMRCHAVIKIAYDEVLMYEKICHGRVPPLVIELLGRPGVGKTAVCQMLMAKLMFLLKRPYSGDTIYNRSIMDDFWSGYDHQPAVLLDDYLQIQSKEKLQATVGEFFKIASPAPFSLNMAEIEQKGKFFTSEVVWLTSNTRSGYNFKDVLGIQDGDAFAGRRNIVLQVEVIDKESQLNWDPSRVVFRFVNPYSHEPFTKWFSFNQILLILFEQYQERIANQANIVSYLMQAEHDSLDTLRELAKQPILDAKTGNYLRSNKEGYNANVTSFLSKVIPNLDEATFDMDVENISEEQFQQESRFNPEARPFQPKMGAPLENNQSKKRLGKKPLKAQMRKAAEVYNIVASYGSLVGLGEVLSQDPFFLSSLQNSPHAEEWLYNHAKLRAQMKRPEKPDPNDPNRRIEDVPSKPQYIIQDESEDEEFFETISDEAFFKLHDSSKKNYVATDMPKHLTDRDILSCSFDQFSIPRVTRLVILLLAAKYTEETYHDIAWWSKVLGFENREFKAAYPKFGKLVEDITKDIKTLFTGELSKTQEQEIETIIKAQLPDTWQMDSIEVFEKEFEKYYGSSDARITNKSPNLLNRVQTFLKKELFRIRVLHGHKTGISLYASSNYEFDVLSNGFSVWKPIFKGVVGALAALTSVIVVGKMFFSSTPEEEYQSISQASHDAGRFKGNHRSKRGDFSRMSQRDLNHQYNVVRRMHKQDTEEDFEGQMLNEDIARKIQANTVELSVSENGKVRRLINGTFLFGRSLITACHFVDSIYEFNHLDIKCQGEKDFTRYRLDAIDIVEVPSTDLVMITIKSASMRAFKNLMNHIPPKDSFPTFLKDGISVVGRTSVLSTDYANIKTDQTYVSEGQTIEVPYGIFHYAGLPSGSCGRLYVNNDGAAQYHIIGMHTAGNGVTSFGTVLFRELVEMMCSSELVRQMNIPEPVIDVSIINNCKGNEVIVVTRPEYAVNMSGRSEFVKSPLFDEDINKEVPGLLFPKVNPNGEVVKPLEQALIKKLKPEYTFEDEDFDQSVDIFINCMPSLFEPRTLSLDEALNGIPETGVLAGIEVKTSPGYPHNLPSFKRSKGLNKPGKGDFVVLHPTGRRTATELLLAHIEEVRREAKEMGTVSSCIIQDTLKDETLPFEKVFVYDEEQRKVFTGKTRIMGPLPIEHLVLERQLFGAFFVNILLWRKKLGFCDVGINPHSLDVHLVLTEILPTKDTTKIKVIAGDISGIDGSIKMTLLNAFEKIVEAFYKNDPDDTEENRRLRKVYHSILAKDCLHIAGNVIYKTTSNPSGRFLTTVINSVVVVLALMTTCLKKTTDKNKAAALLTKARVFGDDHVVFFHEDDMWFDMHDVEATMKIMGMKYTGTDKTAELPKFYEFKDVKYLNRYFLRDNNGFFHAACEKSTIEQIGQWKPRKVPLDDWLPNIYSSALYEAFHWGPEYFSERKRFLLKTIKNNLPMFPLNSLTQVNYHDIYMSFTTSKTTSDSSKNDQSSLKMQAQSGKELHVSDTVESSEREDRTAVVASTDHQTILTDYADTVNNQTSDVRISNVPSFLDGTDPYPDQGLQKVLSRMYPVASFDWAQTDLLGANILSLTFPRALRNLTTLSRLDKFNYYRSGVEVSIRLNTTQFNSGMLLASWIPHYKNAGGFTKHSNVYEASGANCMTISANTQDTITFAIPYIAPSAYTVNMTTTASDYHDSFAELHLWVVAPLLNGMNISSSVGVTVYARFIDTEVSGPVWKAQMNHGKGNVTKEQEKKSENNLLSQIVSSSKRTIFSKASKVVGKVLDDFADSVPIGSLLRMGVGTLFDLPTTTKQIERVSVSSGSNFSFVKGLDNSTMLGSDPENHVATDASMFNIDKDYDLFDNYKKLPMIAYIGSFGQSNLRHSIVYQTPVTPFICSNNGTKFQLTHLGNLASFFSYWRGDIRFMFQFVCNKFVSTRVRIEWLPVSQGTTASDLEGDGNTINKVFDINGDTVVKFTVPFLAQKSWLNTGRPNSALANNDTYLSTNGQIRVSIVNPISSAQADGVDPQVRFVVWIAGGDSFQVQYPRFLADYSMTAQSGISYLDPRAMFEEEFEGLIPCRLVVDDGLIHGEAISSFSELCKRFERVASERLSTANNYRTIVPTFVESNLPQRYLRIHNTFMFSRGSRRFKVIGTGVAGVISDNILRVSTIAGAAGLDYSGQQPMMLHYLGLNPVVEVQLPFNYTYPLYAHKLFSFEQEQVPQLVLTSLTQTDLDLEIYWAVGDDFKFGWPIAPNPVFYDP